MNKKFYGLLILSILVFVAIPTFASHSWNGYHWARSQNPVSLTLGDNVSSVWEQYLKDAQNDWNKSDVLSLSKVAGSEKPHNCKSSASNYIAVCSDSYGYNGWLGIAGISVSGKHITSAYTKMNDTYFNTSTYDTPGWRQMVMCQEVGHTFGLAHQDENFDNPNLGTCMDYTNDPTRNDGAGNNLHPNQHDYDELDIVYSHLDSSGGGGGTCHGHNCAAHADNGINAADYSARSEWGQLVHQNGRIAVYERDFGNGNKVLTTVIWAN